MPVLMRASSHPTHTVWEPTLRWTAGFQDMQKHAATMHKYGASFCVRHTITLHVVHCTVKYCTVYAILPACNMLNAMFARHLLTSVLARSCIRLTPIRIASKSTSTGQCSHIGTRASSFQCTLHRLHAYKRSVLTHNNIFRCCEKAF
jgi:hypothetical protein